MRIRLSVKLSLLSLAFSFAAVASNRSGEKIFIAACAACHGSDGRGVSYDRSGLPLRPIDLTDCMVTNREPDNDWHAVIAEGGPARGFNRIMPAFGEALSGEEQKAVLVYIRGFCTDSGYPRGNLNMPRPLMTEKAFVEDEFVISAAMETRSPGNVDGKLVYEKRFLRRQQFEVIVPFTIAKMDDGSREAGIGDIAVGVKSVLMAASKTGSILSIAGEVTAPVGNEDKGFGKGVFVFEPFLAFGQALPWEGFLHVQAGAEIPTEEAKGVETEGFLRTALGASLMQGRFGRSFSPIIEGVLIRDLESDAPTIVDLVPQLQVSLSRRQHILASLGVRVPVAHREGRSPQVMFYLLWDFFDGGLFEGW